jgi:hypothetical protein
MSGSESVLKKSPILCSIEGVGSIVDSNIARQLRCFGNDSLDCCYVPKKTFALSEPHISDECSERAKKKRKSWASHLDATDPKLADLITKSHFELFSAAKTRFPVSESLFEKPDLVSEPYSEDEFRSVCEPSAFLYSGIRHRNLDLNPDLETLTNSQPKYLRLQPAASTRPPLDADRTTRRDQIIHIGAREYVVPDGASFYMGDIREGLSTIQRELVPPHGFRLAVVDPPWPSKSRGKKVHFTHPSSPPCVPPLPAPDAR